MQYICIFVSITVCGPGPKRPGASKTSWVAFLGMGLEYFEGLKKKFTVGYLGVLWPRTSLYCRIYVLLKTRVSTYSFLFRFFACLVSWFHCLDGDGSCFAVFLQSA